MSLLHDVVLWLTFPPALSAVAMGFVVFAVILHRTRLALTLGVMALGWTLIWSLPACSVWLRKSLEQRDPVVAASALPQADAIVVLGGGAYDWLDDDGVRAEQLTNSRVAAGARAWMAGRAPVVILSGGGRPGHIESRRMAVAITRLGVPSSVLLLEQRSRNTGDNARFTAQLARRHGIRSILLVTSALHMPRASLLFRDAGMKVVASPVPEPEWGRAREGRWIPSRTSLWRSGRALKEYAGLLDVHLQHPVGRR